MYMPTFDRVDSKAGDTIAPIGARALSRCYDYTLVFQMLCVWHVDEEDMDFN